MLVSPYARQGFIDSTELDFTSILRFIADNWGLPPLSERSARANSLAGAFDFDAPPRPPVLLPFERVSAEETARPPRLFVVYLGYGLVLVLACVLILLVFRGPALDERARGAAETGERGPG
jgi:phospholipase C